MSGIDLKTTKYTHLHLFFANSRTVNCHYLLCAYVDSWDICSYVNQRGATEANISIVNWTSGFICCVSFDIICS